MSEEQQAAAEAVAEAFDLLSHIEQGYKFEKAQGGYNVLDPQGRHGFGASPEEAIKNIDAQLLYVARDEYIGRLLVRRDGSEVRLDKQG